MLKRLYVHNYKCLVNFEINFDKDISLFLGANGSGKSTIFEVLDKIIKLVIDEEKVTKLFNNSNSPRWLKNGEPRDFCFEMDIVINNYFYKYRLVIDLGAYPSNKAKIKEESLYCDGDKLRELTSELFDGSRSCLYASGIAQSYCGGKDMWLWSYLQTILTFRINPYAMTDVISNTISFLAHIKSDFSNYADWFAFLNKKHRKQIATLERNLSNIIKGFDCFRIEQAGRAEILQVEFNNVINPYDFSELSEGQKVLIALYTLIYCTPDNSILCIDEPENFLALPEIQPWLNALRDQCSERNLQILLISHHPSLINFLAASSGYWFSRQDNHTRIEKIAQQDESGLSLAQLIEMGWIYGD
ncbi:MAG: AAA family ATPase [Methylococcaceae bacterium]